MPRIPRDVDHVRLYTSVFEVTPIFMRVFFCLRQKPCRVMLRSCPAPSACPIWTLLTRAGLRMVILAQQDHYKAQHENLSATLRTPAIEYKRLKMLVDKLQRMLFGAKRERVLRQIEQLELELEELGAAGAL
jgi:hypothetical protein